MKEYVSGTRRVSVEPSARGRILILAPLTGGLLALLGCRHESGNDPKAERPVVAVREPEKKVELVASLPKEVFEEAEPVEVHLVIRNDTAGPVTIWGREPWNDRMIVKSRRGDEAVLTDEGRRWRGRFGSSFFSHAITLEGGKSLEYSKVQLHELHELPPGEYTAQVLYEDWASSTPPFESKLRLESKPVNFTVVPRTGSK